MKALSLRQPWLHFVLHCGKRIENRRWNTGFRGPFLLHASKGMTRSEYVDACSWYRTHFELEPHQLDHLPLHDGYQRGGFAGKATLVDVIPPFNEAVAELVKKKRPGLDLRWWMREQYGLVLTDVTVTPFQPALGALGFFDAGARLTAG